MRNEGFLTREHEEQRKRGGVEALTRFYHEEEAAGGRPAGVEQEFGFALGATKVRGRFDRVDATPEGVVIIDYKSSDVTEQRRADQRHALPAASLYALATRDDARRPPGSAPLPRVGSRRPPSSTEQDLAAPPRGHAAAAGIRALHSRRSLVPGCRTPYNQIAEHCDPGRRRGLHE